MVNLQQQKFLQLGAMQRSDNKNSPSTQKDAKHAGAMPRPDNENSPLTQKDAKHAETMLRSDNKNSPSTQKDAKHTKAMQKSAKHIARIKMLELKNGCVTVHTGY